MVGSINLWDCLTRTIPTRNLQHITVTVTTSDYLLSLSFSHLDFVIFGPPKKTTHLFPTKNHDAATPPKLQPNDPMTAPGAALPQRAVVTTATLWSALGLSGGAGDATSRVMGRWGGSQRGAQEGGVEATHNSWGCEFWGSKTAGVFKVDFFFFGRWLCKEGIRKNKVLLAFLEWKLQPLWCQAKECHAKKWGKCLST